MNDSDPRPMPPQVLAAYRDPLDLGELFATNVVPSKYRLAVRDELLRRLVTKYGDAEIKSGSRFVSVARRVKRLDDPWESIELLMSIPEYGGEEIVKLELAHTMQPYWARWWTLFEWKNWDDIHVWRNTARVVLGDRQLRWLAAQYARSVFSRTPQKDYYVCREAIESAEAYAADPSDDNLDRMEAARLSAFVTIREAYVAGAYVVASSAQIAFGDALYFASAYHSAPSYDLTAALTRKLITPTLITSASRGLR